MNIKTSRDEQARGILFATMLYGISIVIIKFFSVRYYIITGEPSEDILPQI